MLELVALYDLGFVSVVYFCGLFTWLVGLLYRFDLVLICAA